ncbi:MAG TPA: glycine--tRNA ligase subunit alpha [Candidatus Dojkabacteria bacterium]|nr:glycine--tRNA ligase subunit alpha [Candidatus Dojkabacteria bacterium]HQF37340.1 glycine--tRNA ligase subunit alpha [Candidatus Dojkabacteria bacterium]
MIKTFQDIISELNNFWSKQGCSLMFPYGIEVGAGTSNPNTALNALIEDEWNVAYVEPSRRPADGRYADSDYRLQHFFQYQVVLKPAPADNIDIYLKSLQTIGLEPDKHDIRLVEDNWENPSLGATGLGWEIWYDGMEISQYTYFQQLGGMKVEIPTLEISYGLERIVMKIQQVSSVWDIMWSKNVTYAQLFKMSEKQGSAYSLDFAEITTLQKLFNLYQKEAQNCLKNDLPLVAYDYVLKMSHTFNILDARGAIGPLERHNTFSKMREIVKEVLLRNKKQVTNNK